MKMIIPKSICAQLLRCSLRRFVGVCRAHTMEREDGNAFTVLVEGNIGSGKTTFLEHFRRFEDVTLITEPVEAWRDLNGFNLLELMYSDPNKWAMTFQTYVSVTMAEAHARRVSTPIKLMERSLYSARYCFVQNMLETGTLHPANHAVLDQWFQFAVEQLPVRADLIVYLRSSPHVAHERVLTRARSEEQCVPLQYLQRLHRLHEDWLVNRTFFSCPAPVLILDADRDLEQMSEEYKRSEQRILRRAVDAVLRSPDKLNRRDQHLVSPAVSPIKMPL